MLIGYKCNKYSNCFLSFCNKQTNLSNPTNWKTDEIFFTAFNLVDINVIELQQQWNIGTTIAATFTSNWSTTNSTVSCYSKIKYNFIPFKVWAKFHWLSFENIIIFAFMSMFSNFSKINTIKELFEKWRQIFIFMPSKFYLFIYSFKTCVHSF